jgi:hypothetical protein
LVARSDPRGGIPTMNGNASAFVLSNPFTLRSHRDLSQFAPEGPNCDGMKPPLRYGRATPVRLGFLPWVKLLYLLFDRMIHTLWRKA